MTPYSERADRIRFAANSFQNHVVDEFRAGRLDRRQFLRAATVVGFSAGAAGLLAACGGESGGSATTTPSASGMTGVAGGTILAGALAPGADLDPTTMSAAGGVCLFTQTGEYLSLSNGQPELTPMLATGWQPNDDASIWTFSIRDGVTFNDGTPLTARDVAATFNRISDPDLGATAYNSIGGMFLPGAVEATDDLTVVFELEAPTGSFSWLVSSDLFGGVILPENYDGGFESTFIGTGPWLLEEYVRDERASFVRNEDYWGELALPDRVEFTLFADDTAMLLALQSKSIEVVNSLTYARGRAVIDDTANFTTQKLQSSAHRFWTMRTDVAPLDDARVRQAIALSVDREAIVGSLVNGLADIGNDSPLAPVFGTTDTAAPQRTRDLDQAKALLAEAGYDGTPLGLVVSDSHEIAELGQVLQSQLAEAGIVVELQVLDFATFSGDGRDASPAWDADMAIDSWGSRGVPNTFLASQLKSDGSSNRSRYANAELDTLIADFAAAVDLSTQREISGRMQQLLLEETPAVYGYFVNWLSASVTSLTGYEFTAMGSLRLSQAVHEQ